LPVHYYKYQILFNGYFFLKMGEKKLMKDHLRYRVPPKRR